MCSLTSFLHPTLLWQLLSVDACAGEIKTPLPRVPVLQPHLSMSYLDSGYFTTAKLLYFILIED